MGDPQRGKSPFEVLIKGVEGIDQLFDRGESWIQFNRRVLDQAEAQGLPVLERLRFLSIFWKNLDEFFMVRLPSFFDLDSTSDALFSLGLDETLTKIGPALRFDRRRAYRLWKRELSPLLLEEGVEILSSTASLSFEERARIGTFFMEKIAPLLRKNSPKEKAGRGHLDVPQFSLLLSLKEKVSGKGRLLLLDIPQDIPRLLPLSSVIDLSFPLCFDPKESRFLCTEGVISESLPLLFPEFSVDAVVAYRLTRNMWDPLKDERREGLPTRLEVEEHTQRCFSSFLKERFQLPQSAVFKEPNPLGLSDLGLLQELDRPNLKASSFLGKPSGLLEKQDSYWEGISRGPALLYHPYEAFSTVVDFLRQASKDPQVVKICLTLYRIDTASAVGGVLLEAASNAKEVMVVIEPKARFDEENNALWAQRLSKAGVEVVLGHPRFKVHAKMGLVLRKESRGLVGYAHLGTGNYHEGTSTGYCDFGYLSSDPLLVADVAHLFDALKQGDSPEGFQRLLVSPGRMREEILGKIRREVDWVRRGRGGRIVFKMNALSDETCIEELYRASRAGVEIDLQVRGVCRLVPNLNGLSEHIRVTSIVGRFLEHARAYYFQNGGNEELYLGSADLMPRNLDRRVEVLFPVDSPDLRKRCVERVLDVQLKDNKQSYELLRDGSYRRLKPNKGEPGIDSQASFLENAGSWSC